MFDMKSDVPTDFTGIPIVNNQRSYFFGYKSYRGKDDIENLWRLLENVIKGKKTTK